MCRMRQPHPDLNRFEFFWVLINIKWYFKIIENFILSNLITKIKFNRISTIFIIRITFWNWNTFDFILMFLIIKNCKTTQLLPISNICPTICTTNIFKKRRTSFNFTIKINTTTNFCWTTIIKYTISYKKLSNLILTIYYTTFSNYCWKSLKIAILNRKYSNYIMKSS